MSNARRRRRRRQSVNGGGIVSAVAIASKDAIYRGGIGLEGVSHTVGRGVRHALGSLVGLLHLITQTVFGLPLFMFSFVMAPDPFMFAKTDARKATQRFGRSWMMSPEAKQAEEQWTNMGYRQMTHWTKWAHRIKDEPSLEQTKALLRFKGKQWYFASKALALARLDNANAEKLIGGKRVRQLIASTGAWLAGVGAVAQGLGHNVSPAALVDAVAGFASGKPTNPTTTPAAPQPTFDTAMAAWLYGTMAFSGITVMLWLYKHYSARMRLQENMDWYLGKEAKTHLLEWWDMGGSKNAVWQKRVREVATQKKQQVLVTNNKRKWWAVAPSDLESVSPGAGPKTMGHREEMFFMLAALDMIKVDGDQLEWKLV
jgi:hypothetical protein